MTSSRFWWSLLLFVGLCWPADAFAWGPATHLDFGLQIVRGALIASPVVRALLNRHSRDYLYGCLAADIVVGKNMARYVDHCHNWNNGLRLLDVAKSDAHRALAYGFLSHLGADIVAHNYFVPFKTVESFRSRGASHAYWELRFDRVAHDNSDVWETFTAMRRLKYPGHDEFLQENLQGASRLMSFGTSKRVFKGAVAIMAMDKWRKAMRAMAAKSILGLCRSEVTEYNRLVVGAVSTLIASGGSSKTCTADPVGRVSLKACRQVRRTLRRLDAEHCLDESKWRTTVIKLRRSFRISIYDDLELPDLEREVGCARRHS